MSIKSKSLETVEQKMQNIDPHSLRYRVLESVKHFKTSWIELGESMYSVWRDKLYREWGYSTFDTYSVKEAGIKKETAMKLLRSYYFLEKEEPSYLKKEYVQSIDAARLPTYESIDALRLAKGKKILDDEDYSDLKKNVFEKGKDSREIKKDLTALIRQRKELEPEEARAQRKLATIKRLLSTLRSLTQELQDSKLVPFSIIKEASHLIKELETQVQ